MKKTIVKTTTSLLAQEGFKPLLYTLIVLALFSILDFGALFFFGVIFLIGEIMFFHNPEREPEEVDELAIISPVDGKIREITSKEDGVEVVIENTIVDPHFIRSPMEITIDSISQTRGLFLPLSNPSATTLNENTTVDFRHKRKKFSLKLQSGYVKIPISIYEEEKSKIPASKRIGFFGGGIATLYCPKETELKVSVGSNVRAGESLLGFAK